MVLFAPAIRCSLSADASLSGSTYFIIIKGENFIITPIYSRDYFHGKILGMSPIDEVPLKEDVQDYYETFNILVNNKERTINAVNKRSLLYKLQKKFLNNYLEHIPLPDCVCGFVKEKNYLDFLIPHCKKKYYLRIDIKDFFNSLKENLVRDCLSEYIDTPNENEKILDEFISITTLHGSLPQGAITSPQLSNILMRRIDIRFRKYCDKFKVQYTRYADDMLFSSDNPEITKSFFIGKLKDILKDINLRINSKKVIKGKDKIILNGYIVSDKVSLTRKKLKTLNTLLYAFENNGSKRKYPKSFIEFKNRLESVNPNLVDTSKGTARFRVRIINYLAGYRAYLLSLNESSINEYTCDFSRKIERTEKALEILSSIKL
ncbi:reverse transcriptase family protein [Neobacillus sp.]|uniref:reverse transcriptase family protein n=1 Tax=Neobacillus sp. TaxID=2675273 RepID=UPI002899CF08|nr:reverse transcriptase family protein [Neobacillus sp.]